MNIRLQTPLTEGRFLSLDWKLSARSAQYETARTPRTDALIQLGGRNKVKSILERSSKISVFCISSIVSLLQKLQNQS